MCYELYPATNILSLDEVYPDWYKMGQREVSIKNVPVEKIVGIVRKEGYDKNFMPKEPNGRWLMVLESMLKHGYKLDRYSTRTF